jgi:hypothetical protein
MSIHGFGIFDLRYRHRSISAYFRSLVSFPMYQFFVTGIVFERIISVLFPSKKYMIGNDNVYFLSFPTDFIRSGGHVARCYLSAISVSYLNFVIIGCVHLRM